MLIVTVVVAVLATGIIAAAVALNKAFGFVLNNH